MAPDMVPAEHGWRRPVRRPRLPLWLFARCRRLHVVSAAHAVLWLSAARPAPDGYRHRRHSAWSR